MLMTVSWLIIRNEYDIASAAIGLVYVNHQDK
jgi:hypothetical protein